MQKCEIMSHRDDFTFGSIARIIEKDLIHGLLHTKTESSERVSIKQNVGLLMSSAIVYDIPAFCIQAAFLQ